MNLYIDVEEVGRCLCFFQKINRADLEDIAWMRDGKELVVDKKLTEQFALIGLSNRDFPSFAGWLPEGLGLEISVMKGDKK